MDINHQTTILIILDGWGHSDNTFYNAIYSADKPTWDKIWSDYPHTLINASGIDVGLPNYQMGNSEVGHMNIGSGRIVDQEYTRISRSIKDESFFKNEPLSSVFQKAEENQKAVHILGLLSNGGVHSHENHILSLIEMAAKYKVKGVYLHAFLDGRDTLPKSAMESILKAQMKMKELGCGQISSIIGRYYAMDRNKRWERTKIAYDLISMGQSEYEATDPMVAVDMAYERGESDEFISPTAIILPDHDRVTVEDGDVMIFANYRADRARQLSRAFTKPNFKSFIRAREPKLANFISLTSYKANYEFPVAFPPQKLVNTLGEYIAKRDLSQLRIAETEKYAHVTFFFNGGKETVFEKEDRILVPSPHISTYDQMPEMSVYEITNRLVPCIKEKKYDLIICNFANADMVGHTGNFNATIQAIQAIDQCLEQIIKTTIAVNGEIIITADHGNAEQMKEFATEKIRSQPYTAHTNNLVPLIYIGRPATFKPVVGSLSDVSPTLLDIMKIPQPEEMTGISLIDKIDKL